MFCCLLLFKIPSGHYKKPERAINFSRAGLVFARDYLWVRSGLLTSSFGLINAVKHQIVFKACKKWFHKTFFRCDLLKN